MARHLTIAAALAAALSGFLLFTPVDASAAETCSSFQSLCAARCKQRAPQDTNCVSDHCTPKLGECRRTGCWQEGRLYGGAQTCNLRKT